MGAARLNQSGLGSRRKQPELYESTHGGLSTAPAPKDGEVGKIPRFGIVEDGMSSSGNQAVGH